MHPVGVKRCRLAKGLHFALELEEWCYSYERAVSRVETYSFEYNTCQATSHTPAILKSIVQSAITATMDDHIRISMK